MHFRNLIAEAKKEPFAFQRRLTRQLQEGQSVNAQLNCFLRMFLSPETVEQTFPLLEKRKRDNALFGLTCAVKDCFAVKGSPLTWGMAPPVIPHAGSHSAAVTTLVEAGVSLVGSTNLDPLCLGILGENPFYGRVTQPYFRERIPGGSSAGSAAAVAANLCDFALASDLSGSTRAPAACCCITGMRCSSELFSKQDSILLSSMIDSVGLLSIEASDIATILHATFARQPVAAPEYELLFPAESEVTLLDPFTENALSDTLNRLSGISFRNDQMIGFDTANTLIKELVAIEFAEKIQTFNIPNLPDPAKALCRLAQSLTPYKREELRERQHMLRDTICGMLGSSALLATPTLPARPPAWKTLRREKRLIDNLNYFLTLANVCDLPAVSVVLGVPGEQFPFSLQLIGAPGTDFELIQYATNLQEKLVPSRGKASTPD